MATVASHAPSPTSCRPAPSCRRPAGGSRLGRPDPGSDPFGSLQWPDLRREFFGSAPVVSDERVKFRGPPFAEDPMNVPVSVAALGRRFLADTEHLHREWCLVQTDALSPALPAMSHMWAAAGDGAQTVAAKGSPEAVMDLCHLDEARRARIAAVVEELAADALHVLAVARGGFIGHDWPASEHDFDFEFVGLLGLADPARPEVPAAVAECRAAGIRVLMTIVAEIVAVKNGVALMQKKEGSALPESSGVCARS
jgi:magnesium-transporting ATPase (P-type)